MVEHRELRHRIVAQPAQPVLVGGGGGVDVAADRRRRHVQEGKVPGIERAFHRLRPVAHLQAFRHVAMRWRQRAHLELRQLGWHALAGAEVSPHHFACFARCIRLDRDLAVVGRIRRHVRHIDAASFHVVLPAVVDAAQAAVLVAAEEEVGAAVRAAGLDQADTAIARAEGDQVLSHHAQTNRWRVRRRQLARERHGQPVPAEILAHCRARTCANEKLVVRRGKHAANLNGVGRARWGAWRRRAA